MILLDTCALLWLAANQKKLSPKAKQTIAEHAGSLFVSAITAFEIATKHRRGTLALSLPPREWYAATLDFHGIRELPVTGEIAIASAQLPRLHNDPCDRIIIATAAMNGMQVLTPDRLISQYRQGGTVW
jgi:PIN domain nuclease of toxin-antitoxin system